MNANNVNHVDSDAISHFDLDHFLIIVCLTLPTLYTVSTAQSLPKRIFVTMIVINIISAHFA